MTSLEKLWVRWVIIRLQTCLLVRQVPHRVDSIPCTISDTICADSCTVDSKQMESGIIIQVSFLESCNFGLILQAERFFFLSNTLSYLVIFFGTRDGEQFLPYESSTQGILFEF